MILLFWLLCKIDQPIISPSTGFCKYCGNSHIAMRAEEILAKLEYLEKFINKMNEKEEIELPQERLDILNYI